ncbi:potassium channel family protein [Candidatus Lucifugimonas marina]|jgi:trk system potassium uptake protein TrkA|uniref:TrkA family potassium uptake protein n=1 Tax=Candidatus Lucifugimonas marina TaxID=3038979 RepID=A0AAJ5ZGI8_9CHLR|nr:TrkA family potassium uptake protein [SAR202 cluster bacterium JH702]MDG0869664.1 TrkA family potassium uptake protein [SAR202 cluster bacterium JH639]WFG34397.1 TrkA family potassium uptake protein [SAR202 cluster bacterium JH545]WFG38326.1 TrkA family potassium uptake protein [SAR202 cluster bacterium JH1073]
MNVIIVGAGNLGSSLARKLSDLGHRITIIEKNPKAVSLLPRGRVDSGAMTIVHRDGSTSAGMLEAGISDADVFVAATGKDSLNGLAAQRAKLIYRVEEVMTVVRDEGARTLYDSLGISTINKASLASDYFVTMLTEEA